MKDLSSSDTTKQFNAQLYRYMVAPSGEQ